MMKSAAGKFGMVISKISFRDLPNFSHGKKRILWTRFSIKRLLDVRLEPVLNDFFSISKLALGLAAAVGHADFYINDGHHKLGWPEFAWDCYHHRAVRLWTSSFYEPCIACP